MFQDTTPTDKTCTLKRISRTISTDTWNTLTPKHSKLILSNPKRKKIRKPGDKISYLNARGKYRFRALNMSQVLQKTVFNISIDRVSRITEQNIHWKGKTCAFFQFGQDTLLAL